MSTINVSTDLIVQDCPVCGIFYAIPSRLDEKRKEDGGHWFCPNGHTIVYTQSEAMRLRHKLDQCEAELNGAQNRLDGALKDITVKKREITRLKNRIHAGVCIECHRHFENLERHMKSEHGKGG